MGQTTSSTACHRPTQPLRLSIPHPIDQNESPNDHHDYTTEIPDDCLALIFNFLRSADRKTCSLVCRRWHAVDGQSRHRLALNATAEVAPRLPSIFSRFGSVTKLALRCDRKTVSINNDGLTLIAQRCRNLTRLKIRGCYKVSEVGMANLANSCKSLRKFSCNSCVFGAKGMNALLDNCSSLEELSVKRLRGPSGGLSTEPIGPGLAAGSLKSLTLKELHNGQCFGPLIIGSKNLKSLKILRCLGDWDRLFETVTAKKRSCLSEIYLERLQVSDLGLNAISKCESLEILHLVKVPDCSNDGVTAIAENCRLLRKLHIDGWRTNRIGDDGLIAIAKNSANLVELVLIGVNPSSVSLMAVAANCQKLERLALCGSETIGDTEISCIVTKCTALKKLCIKSCNVTDSGIRAFAYGCPNLVKIKVKKCRGVTSEVADWLRARRVTLAVNMDGDDIEVVDASTSDGGVADEGVEFPQIVSGDGPSTGTTGRTSSISRLSLFVGCAFRRLSNGNGHCSSSNGL